MKSKSKILVFVLWLFMAPLMAQTFQDLPGNEPIGDFPAKWDLVSGSAQIGNFDGGSIISLSNKSIIKPLLNSTNYLTDNFSMSFEAYFDDVRQSVRFQFYEVRFWDGKGHILFPSNGGRASYNPVKIYRDGISLTGSDSKGESVAYEAFQKDMETKGGLWRLVNLEFRSGTLKIFIDGIQIINVPRYLFKPEMVSIGVYAREYNENFVHGIRNIQLDGIDNSSGTMGTGNTSTGGTSNEGGTGSTTYNDSTATGEETPTNDETNNKNSGLESLNEGNGGGWRLIGRDPTKYGEIGLNAIDFSYSTNGDKNGATGENSMAWGENTIASGLRSTSIGFKTEASGINSIAIGEATKASGNNSTAIGLSSEASRERAIAIGRNATAIGFASIAFGDNSRANQTFSVAIGNGLSSRRGAYAIGSMAHASGEYSMALGPNTIAESYFSTALGRFNIGGGDPKQWNDFDPLLEIGNGLSNSPSNALTVLKNGNIGIGTHEPKSKLHIRGGSDAGHNGGGYFVIGDLGKTNMVFDNNEIIVRYKSNPATLHLQNDGGDVFVGGSVVHSSDKRLKQDIVDLSYGLDEVLQLRPVSYRWKSDSKATQRSIGLIAQEVQPIMNELITTNSKRDNTLGVNYTELIPLLIKAIQEQQGLIEDQNNKIDELTNSLEKKDELFVSLNRKVRQIEDNLKI